MYRLLIDCTPPDEADRGYAGFIALKFEDAVDRDLAIANATHRTKIQMASKGFAADEIEKFAFAVEEIEVVDPACVDRSAEDGGFAYY